MPAPSAFTTADNTLRFWTEWHGAGRFFAVFAATLLAAWFVKLMLFKAIARFTAKSEAQFDDTLLGALRWPARYWVVLIALVTAVSDVDTAEIPVRIVSALSLTILILLTVSMALAIARVSILLLQHSMQHSSSGIEITTLTKLMIRVFWGVPAALIVLRALHIDITLALTTVGVGGIAISLALKDTLANVFAGFYISLSGQLHKGDYIRLSSGIEGYVVDIHWRLTTLRTLQNNMVLLPNASLSESVVINFSQPAKPLSIGIAYGVDYDTDLDRLDAVVFGGCSAAGRAAGRDAACHEPGSRASRVPNTR